MNWLQILTAVFALAPKVVAFVNEIDTLFPGAGLGVFKKLIVMAPLASAPTEVQSAVSTLVDNVVAAKKATPEATPAPTTK
jgi:hypothetical protein